MCHKSPGVFGDCDRLYYILNVDKEFNLDLIYLNFFKAFDTVPGTPSWLIKNEPWLIEKIKAHSIGGEVLKWLQHTTQRVVLNGSSTTWKVLSGDSQGSLLGSLLFCDIH